MNYIPRVQISVPPDRDYVMTLTQTKIVYDQLLGDKHNKLTEVRFKLHFKLVSDGSRNHQKGIILKNKRSYRGSFMQSANDGIFLVSTWRLSGVIFNENKKANRLMV